MQLKTFLRRLAVVLSIALTASLTPLVAAQAAPAAASAAASAAPCPADSLTSAQKQAAEVQFRLASVREARGHQLYAGRVDGKWGPLSQSALNAWRMLTRSTRTGPLSTAEYNTIRQETLSGFSAVISLSKQTVTFSRNGQAFYTTHVSTGVPNTRWETPVVRSKVLWQIPGWRKSHLGCLYYPTYFLSSGIAIHGSNSVPRNNPSSHGCVRVTLPEGYAVFKAFQKGYPIRTVR